MSRRPTTTTRTTISRTASSASISMPPPSRIPNRPPSVMSNSAASHRGGPSPTTKDGSESRPTSPSRRTRKPSASSVKGTQGTSSDGNGEINIQVVVRCRGRSAQEVAQSSPIITTTTGAVCKAVTVETTPLPSSSLSSFTTASAYGGSHQPMTKTYPFDKVFGPEADQTMIFNEVADGMLDEVLAGYNCTIFAYGQTGTGKTYTMQGDLELTNLGAPKSTAGIVPRVLYRLFSLLDSTPNTEFSVKCSYVELYNEELRDLLATEYKGDGSTPAQQQNAPGGLKLYEDGKKGVMIQGLEETGIRNLKEALNMLDKGVKRRQTAETKMNTESSRSHTIFSITVHVKESNMHRGGEDLLKVGKFNLVDLAGSEAIGRSGATDKRAREAGMINQSLLTLGRVISALVDKGSHIPYRESKLTRLLQDSLGGRTKTCIMATVSPTRSNLEETLSTLDYAIRAKSIRNRPEVNAHMTKTGLLKEYVGDIERLKAELLASREKNGIYIPEEQWVEMQEEQMKQKSDYDEAKLKAGVIEVELATKKKEFDEVSVRFLATSEELVQAREAERQLTELLDENKVILERIRIQLDEEVVVSRAYMKGEERLDRVAGGLKKMANESVSDVGGLFDKLSRKAKVLGLNADAATVFGSDLQGLSRDLRAGLAQLHLAHDEFSKGVKSGVETFAVHEQQITQADLQTLDRSFSVFTDLAKRLSASNEKGQREASESSRSIIAIKDEVQLSVREWATGISERSAKMVGELLDHQQEHLDTVGQVLESTAALVDAVISTSLAHLSQQTITAQQTRDLALQASSREVDRLESQNELLLRLLSEEKAKTVKLKTALIGDLTSMIEGFTDAQDRSLTGVMEKVRGENGNAVRGMHDFSQQVSQTWSEDETRRSAVESELRMGEKTGKSQRQAGTEALASVREGLRDKLEVYGHQTTSDARAHTKTVDDFCTRLGKSAGDASSKATSRGKKQSDLLSALSSHVGQTHQNSRARSEELAGGIASMSTNLISSQSQSSSSFTQAYTTSTTKLEDMISSTATFLERGIQEDVPTGITPKKKVWNVPSTWQTTGSREAVLANWRKRVAEGEVDHEEQDQHVTEGPEGTIEVDEAERDGPQQEHVEEDEEAQVETEGEVEVAENRPSTMASNSSNEHEVRELSPPLSFLPGQIAVLRPYPTNQVNPLSLSQSQNSRPVSSGLPLPTKGKSLSLGMSANGNAGLTKKMAGLEASGAVLEERPIVTVLGEGVGINVPRRKRK